MYLLRGEAAGELRRGVPGGREQHVRRQRAAQRRRQHGAHAAPRQPRRAARAERVARLQRLLPLRHTGCSSTKCRLFLSLTTSREKNLKMRIDMKTYEVLRQSLPSCDTS